MSKFLSTIPVGIAAVTELLPKRAAVLEVRLNRVEQRVEIIWDDDDFETGYTFPVDFAVELLETKRLPKDVKLRKRKAVPTGSAVTVAKVRGGRGK